MNAPTLQQSLTRNLSIGRHMSVELEKHGVVRRVDVHIPNRGRPQLIVMDKRTPYGHVLAYRVDGDTLGPDGSFWLSEEEYAERMALPVEKRINLDAVAQAA